MPRFDLDAYLAGLFDGEGCISASYRRDKTGSRNHQVFVAVYMCHEGVVRRFRRRFGGHVTRRDTDIGRPGWRWRVNGLAAHEAFTTFARLCTVKRRQAQLALKLLPFLARTATRGNRWLPTPASEVIRRTGITDMIQALNYGARGRPVAA